MLSKIIPLSLLGVGIFVLVQVAMPYLAFKVWEATFLVNSQSLINPTTDKSEVLGVYVENIGNFPALISSNKRELLPYSEFTLTVPKIDLKGVKVKVESNDFEQNLAHLPGTALPGEKGNVFISGHSSLTQFYRPGNFKAIFAKIPKLEKGDLIEVEVLGQKYQYIIEGIKVVEPKEVSIINPPDKSGRYLSLMTCVPPGFNTKRLVVLARLRQ